jgi:hypothetical protein
MRSAPLLDVLRSPEGAARLTTAEWVTLIGAARHSSLLPRLSLLLEPLADALPARVREQLEAARPFADKHARTILWEVERIRDALCDLDVKIVLLKGAAYVVAGLPAGRGRLASDVDILVPRTQIGDVERALEAAGWEPMKLHPYDQRFYRQYSHELPPLRHAHRRTVIDVHHNILPLTGRVRIDAALLLEAAQPVGTERRGRTIWTLAPEDMVLHNAAHLFQDGDLSGSVRDLVDSDALVRDFAARIDGFWTRLPARARALGLTRPLFYALRYGRMMLSTPVPAHVEAELGGPPRPVLALMDQLVTRSLLPVSGQHGTVGEESARLLLYVRSHWLRMPAVQLAAHLGKKARRRWWDDEKDEA